MIKSTTIFRIADILMSQSSTFLYYGVKEMNIIGSYARNKQTPHSDLDILCHWKSKHHWASNSNVLAEFLFHHLKIIIDLTAPFHHEGCDYDIKKIPSIRIF